MHNKDAETAQSKSSKRGNAVLKLVTHKLFYFKYNWCTWKEPGKAVNSSVVNGRLSTFATETMRRKYKLEMEEKYFNFLKRNVT